MFDLHIHMILDGIDFRTAIGTHRAGADEACIRQRLQAYQAAGVHFLRDGGDAFGVCMRARELARDYGIDYRAPAFPIHRRGHYGAFIGRGFETLSEYSALLDQAERQGADFIKLMISGLIDFSNADRLTGNSLSEDEIVQMIHLAHGRGFSVMAHANGDRAVNAALDAGVESIEHGAFLSEATLLRMKHTLWVPTLSTIGNLIGCGRYPDEPLRRLLREQTEKVHFAYSHGALIGSGSDAGAYCVHHANAHRQERIYLSFLPDGHLLLAKKYAQETFRRK